MRERMAEIELALEDIGWYRLGFETQGQISRSGLKRLTSICRALYLKHPLVHHAVDIATHYVWGQGIAVVAKSAEINTVVQAWWDLKDNKREITGHRARMLKERELRLAGQNFFTLFTDPIRGTVRTSSIPVDEVDAIITNPDNRREPWFYHRRYMAGGTYEIESGITVGTKTVNEYYPDWQYQPSARPASYRDIKIRWDAPVYHMKVGGLDNMLFGVPEIFSAIDWARAVQTDLENYATVRKALARFAFTLTTKGTRGALSKAAEQLQSTISVLSGGGETNPPPVAGSTLLQRKDQAELQPVRTAGVQPSPDEGRRLGLMAGAGFGIPETMLWGDTTVGNYATAKSLDRPTELAFLTRQKDWMDTFIDITSYVVDASGRATRGQLKSKTIKDPYSGDESIQILGSVGEASGQPIDRRVDVGFPSILEHDAKDEVQAIVSATTLNGQAWGGMIDKRTVARLLLIALRVNNVDEVLARLHPDEPNPPAIQAELTSPADPTVGPPASAPTPAPAALPAPAQESALQRISEPVRECEADGKPGWKYGDSGKCYTYTTGDQAGNDSAKNKAYKQGVAMGEEAHANSASALDAVGKLAERLDTFTIGLARELNEQNVRNQAEIVTAIAEAYVAAKPDLQPFVDAVTQLAQRPIIVESKSRRVIREKTFHEDPPNSGHVRSVTEVEREADD